MSLHDAKIIFRVNVLQAVVVSAVNEFLLILLVVE